MSVGVGLGAGAGVAAGPGKGPAGPAGPAGSHGTGNARSEEAHPLVERVAGLAETTLKSRRLVTDSQGGSARRHQHAS